MTDLVNLNSGKKFSSVYLTEQINLFRKKEGYNVIIGHSDLLKKIVKEFEEEIGQGNISPTSYLDSSNRQSKCFDLDYEQSLQILMSESKLVRKGVIEVIKKQQEIINNNFQIPQTYSAALMLAAKQAEQIEIQKEEIKVLEPKAEFYDAVTDSKTAIDMKNAAKVLDLGFGRNTLLSKLRDLKILMRDNQPYQQFIDRGYFRIIETKFTKPDASININIKTLVYQKGLDFIRKQIS